MSKIIYSIFLALLIINISACKEDPIVLNIAGLGQDSTYVSSSENPQTKMILATELTGVECPNCPDGAQMLEQLNLQNGHDLVIVSLHAGSLTTPYNRTEVKSKYDFRTKDGEAILKQIFGGDPGSKPVVAYNRLPLWHGAGSARYFIDTYSQNWDPELKAAMTMENPVLINVSVHSSYNDKTGKYDIEAKVVYNQSISGKQRLNLYLTQDSIVDAQVTTNPNDHYKEDYVFMNVFRKAITGVGGQPILDSLSTKEKGRVYVYRTSISLDAPENQEWVAKNMHVLAFVNQESDNDIHVYQAAKTSLK